MKAQHFFGKDEKKYGVKESKKKTSLDYIFLLGEQNRAKKEFSELPSEEFLNHQIYFFILSPHYIQDSAILLKLHPFSCTLQPLFETLKHNLKLMTINTLNSIISRTERVQGVFVQLS